MSDFKAMQEWLYTDVVKEHFMHPHNMLQEAEESWPCVVLVLLLPLLFCLMQLKE